MVFAHRLGNAKGAVHGPGKGDGQEEQLRLVFCDGLQCQVREHGVHEVGCSSKRLSQGLEARLAARQAFAVTHEFKTGVDGITQHIGQVVQVQRCQMLCAVVLPECTECPGQRVGRLGVAVHIQRGKARTFRQEAAPCDAVAQCEVAPLQKRNRGRNGGEVVVKVV